MADIHCPICDRLNDTNAERCWYCQAILPRDEKPAHESQDWLDGLRGDSTIPAPENSQDDSTDAAAPMDNEAEVPDWLARIRQREQTERPEQPEPSEDAASAAQDWLDDIRAGENQDEPAAAAPEQPESDPASSEPPPVDKNTQDWLKQLESWQPASSPLAEETAPDAAEDQQTAAPAQDLGGSSAQPTVPPVPAPESEPEWLRSLSKEAESAPASQPPQAEKPAEENSPFIQSEAPLSQAEAHSGSEQAQPFMKDEEEPASAEPAAPSQPMKADNTWLTAFNEIPLDEDLTKKVIPSDKNDFQPKAPFSDSSVMDWLEKEAPVEKQPGSDKQVPDANQKPLEPASLPVWLQALRPGKHKEGTAREPSPFNIESSGPLAGIEGTLQGEELSQLYSRPQTYTGPLKVSQGQQDRSLILKKITDQNSWEDEGLTDKTHSQRWILHAVVVVLILTAVFIPLIINGLPSILPALYPEAVVQSFNTVNTLSAEKPVLVAADFDGSLYGELNWTLQPLFSHLMQKNIPMAFLSTNSVGATLMEKSLKELSAKNTAFDYDAEVVDLGYLAGGSIGLQSLARDPLTTMPLTSNLQPAWQSYPLSSIKQLSDFGALIVITENADTARYWIEQVKPSLGNTPLLVIISAQSAPLLQPYYDSGQITGYLAGVNSAAVYEALDQNSQNSGQLFSSYQITMLLVIVLILVGGIVSLIVGPRARETGERS